MVGCLLDVDGAAGTASMSFTLNGKDMGAAFDGVKLAAAAERDVNAAAVGGLMKVSPADRPQTAVGSRRRGKSEEASDVQLG